MRQSFLILRGMTGTEGGVEFAKFFYDLSVVRERDSPELVGRSDDRPPQTTGIRAAGAAALTLSLTSIKIMKN